MIARERTLVVTLFAGVLAAVVLVALVALLGSGGDHEWDGSLRAVDDPLAGFSHPRTVHFAPDGRLLVTDVGTGNDDGRVVAVDLERKTQEVLMRDLPSASVTGQVVGGIAGPSAAAMSPDGTLCVVTGDGPEGRGFAEMRCTNGFRVDLAAYERANNPEGRDARSDPFDVVAAGDRGWYVSDAAANVVLRVGATGTIGVVGVFDSVAGSGTPPGNPTGMALWNGRLTTALFGGAVLTGGGNATVPVFAEVEQPIAAAPPYQVNTAPGGEQFVLYLSYGKREAVQGTGAIRMAANVIVDGLDRPTGFVRLPDGRFVVAEQERGRLRIVEEPK